MPLTYPRFKAAACHIASVFLDSAATVEKGISFIRESAGNGAALVAFPESFVPGFPVWAALRPPIENHDFFRALAMQSVRRDGEEVARLCAAAREYGVGRSDVAHSAQPRTGCDRVLTGDPPQPGLGAGAAARIRLELEVAAVRLFGGRTLVLCPADLAQQRECVRVRRIPQHRFLELCRGLRQRAVMEQRTRVTRAERRVARLERDRALVVNRGRAEAPFRERLRPRAAFLGRARNAQP